MAHSVLLHFILSRGLISKRGEGMNGLELVLGGWMPQSWPLFLSLRLPPPDRSACQPRDGRAFGGKSRSLTRMAYTNRTSAKFVNSRDPDSRAIQIPFVRKCKRNLRNSILEGLFIPRLMLRFPPILADKRNWMRSFHWPSKMRFLRLHLGYFLISCVRHIWEFPFVATILVRRV